MPTSEEITELRRERLKQLFLQFQMDSKNISNQNLLLSYTQVDIEKEPYKREFIKREVGFFRNYKLRTNEELKTTLNHLTTYVYERSQNLDAKYDFDWLDYELMTPLVNRELHNRHTTKRRKPRQKPQDLIKRVMGKSAGA